ncbi:MAG: cytochrome c oxidase cbb3-type subunit 3 [Kiritimatiellia bacterium]|jgi:cytochrome c oxidase cbb3-type subunit 3
MKSKLYTLGLTLMVCSQLSNAQDNEPEIVIANPNATFLAQQRALPPAEVIARGETLYQVNCRMCHGGDLRGGEQGGPNLLRSGMVLSDIAGEVIGPVITQGIGRMPSFGNLEQPDIAAVAGFIHSILATSERQGSTPPVDFDLDILVGNAEAGERYFNQECSSCHSVSGDLRGISSRITDDYDLQNAWVGGGLRRRGGSPGADKTVTVTQADGSQVRGTLIRYDDFFLSLRTLTGGYQSFSRNGDSPQIEISDPLERHKELLAELTDESIHDVTAYMETLK